MSSKAELNAQIQNLASQVKYLVGRCQHHQQRYAEQWKKNAKLNERLARRRNGIFRRLWLRWRALWHK